MKKLLYSSLLLLTLTLSVASVGAATITTGSMPNIVCAGSIVAVSYTASGFGAGNVFTVELSSSSGSFNSPIKIASVAATASGTINVHIPAKETTASGYKVRVVGSKPATTGSADPNFFVIDQVIATPASTSPVCEGSALAFSATANTFVTYSWTGPNGFTSTSSDPTISAASISDSGTYFLAVKDPVGCPDSSSTHVIVNASPIANISGNSAFCSGTTAILSASAAKSYLWSNGKTTSSISVSVSNGYSVTITNTAGCTSSASKNVTVFESPSPVIIPAGSLTFCSGNTLELCVGAYAQYQWSTGQTSQCILVALSGTYSITVTNSEGCSGSTSVITNVVPVVTPSLTINETTSTTFCLGNKVTFKATPTNGGTTPSYQWYLNNVAVGTNGDTFTDSLSATGDNTLICSMTTSLACVTSPMAVSNEIDFNIVNKPIASPIVGERAGNCAGATNSFSVVPTAEFATYTWTLTANMLIESGVGTDSISVHFGAKFTTGTLTVKASNVCGVSAAASATIHSKPVTPGVITGQETGVCQAVLNYSIVDVDDISTYTWALPSNTELVNTSATGDEALIGFLPAFTTGNLTVKATNACGSSAASPALAIAAAPPKPAAIFGPKSACPNGSAVYSIDNIITANLFEWTAPAGASITSGQGTTGVTVTFGPKYAGGTLSVKAENDCGSSAASSITLTKSKTCRVEEDGWQQQQDGTISAYPNPAHDQLTVSFTAGSNALYTIRMMDITGRVVMEKANSATEGNNFVQIGLGSFARGVYFLSVSGEDQSKLMRIAVN